MRIEERKVWNLNYVMGEASRRYEEGTKETRQAKFTL